MTIQTLDWIFPFIVFTYGAVMSISLNTQWMIRLAEKRFPPDLVRQMNGHRGLAIICLVVGSLWSLQNLWQGQI